MKPFRFMDPQMAFCSLLTDPSFGPSTKTKNIDRKGNPFPLYQAVQMLWFIGRQMEFLIFLLLTSTAL